jgi:hypothetical protein
VETHDRTPFLVASAWAGAAFELLLLAAMYAAALGWRPAAFVMLAAAFGQGGLHLGVGVVMYRATMSRPWPSVPSLDDDDDW